MLAMFIPAELVAVWSNTDYFPALLAVAYTGGCPPEQARHTRRHFIQGP
jgi:hypothetical protein